MAGGVLPQLYNTYYVGISLYSKKILVYINITRYKMNVRRNGHHIASDNRVNSQALCSFQKQADKIEINKDIHQDIGNG